MTNPEIIAAELVEKFKPLVTTWDCYNDAPIPDEDITMDAKDCALICCDEILKVLDSGNLYMEQSNDENNITNSDYWQSVRQAVEKM